jgi:hypothetical protein
MNALDGKSVLCICQCKFIFKKGMKGFENRRLTAQMAHWQHPAEPNEPRCKSCLINPA